MTMLNARLAPLGLAALVLAAPGHGEDIPQIDNPPRLLAAPADQAAKTRLGALNTAALLNAPLELGQPQAAPREVTFDLDIRYRYGWIRNPSLERRADPLRQGRATQLPARRAQLGRAAKLLPSQRHALHRPADRGLSWANRAHRPEQQAGATSMASPSATPVAPTRAAAPTSRTVSTAPICIPTGSGSIRPAIATMCCSPSIPASASSTSTTFRQTTPPARSGITPTAMAPPRCRCPAAWPAR